LPAFRKKVNFEVEIYQTDPLEETNLAARQPAIAQRMLRDLETWFEEVEQERASIEDVW